MSHIFNKVKNNIYILIGKIIGSIVSIFWIAVMLLQTFLGKNDLTLEGFLLVILIFFNTTGIFIAFINVRFGSYLIIFSSIMLSIFTYISAGHNEAFTIAVSGLPFLLTGILFFIGSTKSNRLKD